MCRVRSVSVCETQTAAMSTTLVVIKGAQCKLAQFQRNVICVSNCWCFPQRCCLWTPETLTFKKNTQGVQAVHQKITYQVSAAHRQVGSQQLRKQRMNVTGSQARWHRAPLKCSRGETQCVCVTVSRTQTHTFMSSHPVLAPQKCPRFADAERSGPQYSP